MKIHQIVLCYEDMDRIILDKWERDLPKYDLSKVASIDAKCEMSVEEFTQLYGYTQKVASTGTLSNVILPRPADKGGR